MPDKKDALRYLKALESFLYRNKGLKSDIQLIFSSRPQGYNGEFDKFNPFVWSINDLSNTDFNSYSDAWLSQRIKNEEELVEARDRIARGMRYLQLCKPCNNSFASNCYVDDR